MGLAKTSPGTWRTLLPAAGVPASPEERRQYTHNQPAASRRLPRLPAAPRPRLGRYRPLLYDRARFPARPGGAWRLRLRSRPDFLGFFIMAFVDAVGTLVGFAEKQFHLSGAQA